MNINAIDIRQLRYFVAVAEELHFGKAARRLNMSQPPLSQQIKALENFIGAALFWRSNRRVELTSAGQYLLPEARRLVRDVAEVAEKTKQSMTGVVGHLRVGLSFSAPFHPVTSKLLHRFRALYPDVQTELVLYERSSPMQLADLQASDVDVAIVWLDDAHRKPDLLRLDLASDAIQAVVPSNHALAKHKRISIRDLKDMAIISIPRHVGTQSYQCVVRAFAAIKAEPRIVYEMRQMPLIMNMVAAGQGIALLPDFLAKLPIEGIVFRPLVLPRGKPPRMVLNLIGSARTRNAAAVNFIDLARKVARE